MSPVFQKEYGRFTFNPLKHHANWLYWFIVSANNECLPLSDIRLIENIKIIGNNPIDIYTGNYCVEKIIQEIEQFLIQKSLKSEKELVVKLHQNDYLSCTISDSSRWILRLSDDKRHYIHVHPARVGEHITRIKGGAWKTAIVLFLFKNIESLNVLNDIDFINGIRKKFLNLSPIKPIGEYNHLVKACTVIQKIITFDNQSSSN
jgi:hypothetical protein